MSNSQEYLEHSHWPWSEVVAMLHSSDRAIGVAIGCFAHTNYSYYFIMKHLVWTALKVDIEVLILWRCPDLSRLLPLESTMGHGHWSSSLLTMQQPIWVDFNLCNHLLSADNMQVLACSQLPQCAWFQAQFGVQITLWETYWHFSYTVVC